jgi:type IV pilus assembly protein PilA
MADASGFTLIELLVVMIIISILMAVAIPVFLGQKQKALGSNAKGLVKAVQSTMESCGAATTTGGFTAEDGTLVCDQAYVRGDEKGIAGKACGDADAATAFGAITKECWALRNAATPADNDTYSVIAKTTNIKGAEYGWFYLHRTSAGVTKLCGYSVGGTVAIEAVPTATPPAVGTVGADGKRLCATGTW